MKTIASVTVIMAAKDTEAYIQQAVDSVLGQTYENWQLIIIVDHSIDKTLEIAKHYSQKDKRVKVLELKDKRGLYCARNLGIANANGTYLSFLDSDDVWHKDFLLEMISFVEKENLADSIGAFCSFNYIDKDASFTRIAPQLNQERFGLCSLLIEGNVMGNGSCQLLKRDVLVRVGLYNESYASSGDYELILRAIAQKPEHFIQYTNKVLMDYRIHNKSMTSKRLDDRFKALDAFLPIYISKVDSESQRKAWTINSIYAFSLGRSKLAFKWMRFAYPGSFALGLFFYFKTFIPYLISRLRLKLNNGISRVFYRNK